MKELLTKKFWRDVKHTFDEAREGSAPSSPNSQSKANVSAPTGAIDTVQAACIGSSGILFDMDGVLYDADRLIAGAAETVRWVQSEGLPHLFATNTTSRSRADLVLTVSAESVFEAAALALRIFESAGTPPGPQGTWRLPPGRRSSAIPLSSGECGIG